MTSPVPPLVRHRRKQRKWLRVVLMSVAGVLVVLLGAGTWFAVSLASTFDSAQRIEDPFPDDALRPPAPSRTASEPVQQNILLLGSDTRGSVKDLDSAAGTRSDTIMLVNIPADRESIQVVSFMRDFWVDIPGHGKSKLNAAMAWGGIPLVVQTVESLVGVRIDHVAIIDFEGFKGVTDAIGGVTVNNPNAFWATTGGPRLRFEKGPITLNGENALRFVRDRKAFIDGDYQRVRNQQLFMSAVLNKVLSAETLTNPIRVSNLVGSVIPFLSVDEGLNSGYIAPLALEVSHLRGKDVRMFTIPTWGTGQEGVQSVVRVNETELRKIAKALQQDNLADYERPPGN